MATAGVGAGSRTGVRSVIQRSSHARMLASHASWSKGRPRSSARRVPAAPQGQVDRRASGESLRERVGNEAGEARRDGLHAEAAAAPEDAPLERAPVVDGVRRQGAAVRGQVAHALPRQPRRAREMPRQVLRGEAAGSPEPAFDVLLSLHRERSVDAVKRHPVDLAFPAPPVPPARGVAECHRVEVEALGQMAVDLDARVAATPPPARTRSRPSLASSTAASRTPGVRLERQRDAPGRAPAEQPDKGRHNGVVFTGTRHPGPFPPNLEGRNIGYVAALIKEIPGSRAGHRASSSLQGRGPPRPPRFFGVISARDASTYTPLGRSTIMDADS